MNSLPKNINAFYQRHSQGTGFSYLRLGIYFGGRMSNVKWCSLKPDRKSESLLLSKTTRGGGGVGQHGILHIYMN